jgi:hypothetical protein
MMSLVFIVVGLTLLMVTCVITYWLLGQYAARIAALEAQLRLPCPHCQAARDTGWEHPL